MAERQNPPHSGNKKITDGSFLDGIPAHYAALSLGFLSFGLASVAYLPDLQLIAIIDIPVAFLCFMTAALVGLGARKKMGLVLTGVALAAAGLILATLHLVLVKDHPWFS